MSVEFGGLSDALRSEGDKLLIDKARVLPDCYYRLCISPFLGVSHSRHRAETTKYLGLIPYRYCFGVLS